MRIDLFLYDTRAEDMAVRGRQVGDGGFDGLFVAESYQDPFQALAIASQHAHDVVLGTNIALAFPRSPMLTAVAAWDLQRATAGRFVLGLGSQVRRHVERRFSTPFAAPAAWLQEYVQALRHIWGAFQGEHPMDFCGERYTLDFLPPEINPGPLDYGPPAVFLAAVGPVMMRTAGAVADGVFVHPFHTLDYLAGVAEPALARGLRESGRTRHEITVAATVFPVVGTGREVEAARERVRRLVAYYGSTPAYLPVLEQHGLAELGKALRDLMRAGETSRMPALVNDEMLDLFSIRGDTWKDVAAAACERYDGVVDRVTFFTTPPTDASVR